ncbi:hypothetical protein ABZT26_02870 [Streptomyces sp. NPDC005395]|uniref:hypothetical protein n=1 Tax=Streptomyces sp. NPDC005395 TaxID=3157042 RepID=UPI0033B3834E
MSATFDLAKTFAETSSYYLRREKNARQRCAQNMANLEERVYAGTIREAMEASAVALPFRTVLDHAEKAGLYEALKDMRAQLTRQLLTRTPGSSTCQITNEAARMDVEAAQSFLQATEGLLEMADDSAAKPAPEPSADPTPEPAAQPAPVNVPKATPAQKRTLTAIRDNGVKLQYLLNGRMEVQIESGAKPRKDMVEWVIAQGWAAKGTCTSVREAQPVHLTAIGEAILAN